MPPRKFQIPANEMFWEEAVKRAGLEGKTIHTLESMSSGSKIIPSQFLTFRVLCVPHQAHMFDAEKWELTEHMIPRNHQRHVMEAKRLTSQKARLVDPDHVDAWSIIPTTDEEIVNFAIVDWLQAVCLRMPGVHGQWIASRYRFRARFGPNELEARTDGALRIFEEPERVHALIECKAIARKDALPAVQFQEAAQIVAWLMQRHRPETAKAGGIFMVSEDREEVFLTFGTLDRHYLRYLQNKDAPKKFLELHTYGPFRIDSAGHMEQLASIVLAYVLRSACLEKIDRYIHWEIDRVDGDRYAEAEDHGFPARLVHETYRNAILEDKERWDGASIPKIREDLKDLVASRGAEIGEVVPRYTVCLVIDQQCRDSIVNAFEDPEESKHGGGPGKGFVLMIDPMFVPGNREGYCKVYAS
ncbi:uncharacterized protein CDV56_104155 [Aspergillus thermomutatus]|uniref:Uncharacterized protein n=1 Tax=Aspergillus thermomutatus TaxID=41047 RepID=A0A397H2R8_ASPTH|nr:uncharacterized protein CDV56_104155 [Aspergillus thermomutatus]RHZ55926.1 hypothetical protein CDV56_104155 [Aspergillus thermomutatus]